MLCLSIIVATVRIDTHQALGARVYDSDEHNANGKPCLRVLSVEIAERDHAQSLHDIHT